MKGIDENLRPWLTAWVQHFYRFDPCVGGGPGMVKNTSDKEDARRSYREEAGRFGTRLYEFAVAVTTIGKTGRMKRDEKFCRSKALNALANHFGITLATPRPKTAPPATGQEIADALAWAFLEFWPQRGVDLWLDDDIESLIEPDEHEDEDRGE